MFYRLDGHQPVKVDMDYFDEWLSDPRREKNSIVGQDRVGNAVVSTVFLCVDHATTGIEPILFETAVFEDCSPRNITRYPTWEAAEIGHQQTLKLERDNYDLKTTKPAG